MKILYSTMFNPCGYGWSNYTVDNIENFRLMNQKKIIETFRSYDCEVDIILNAFSEEDKQRAEELFNCKVLIHNEPNEKDKLFHIKKAADQDKDYDYVIFAEEDIEIKQRVIDKLDNLYSKIDNPNIYIDVNMFEYYNNEIYFVQLGTSSEWLPNEFQCEGNTFKQFNNNHSCVIILNKKQQTIWKKSNDGKFFERPYHLSPSPTVTAMRQRKQTIFDVYYQYDEMLDGLHVHHLSNNYVCRPDLHMITEANYTLDNISEEY